jgi:hypothetical protein
MLKQGSNFEKSKRIIKALVGQHLTAGEYSFCIYLIDQQYGYSSSKGLSGDSAGYGHISKITGFSADRIKTVVRLLTAKNIVLKENYATKYGNRYRFNENYEEWHHDVARRTHKRKGVKKGSKTSATSIAEDTGVVLPIIPPVVLHTPPPVVLPAIPNSKVSSVKNETVNDEAVDDKDAPPAFFRNNRNNENTGVTDEQLAGYKDLLRKSYPNLDVTKEFQLFQDAYPNLKDNKQIALEFTVWLEDARNKEKA